MIRPPCTAYMRNGKPARITGVVSLGDDNQDQYLQGAHDDQRVELWHMSGQWSDRPAAQHPLDLMHVRSSTGQIVAINHQPAVA